jgi:hypothetical protein
MGNSDKDPEEEELTSAEVSFASEELLDGAGVGTDFPEEVDTIVDQGVPTGEAVYVIAVPDVPALEEFARTALARGGVLVTTADARPVGVPVVVAVVHPLSGDRFHLDGEVVPHAPERPGVAVRFSGLTETTRNHFRTFVGLGIPDVDGDPASVDVDLDEPARAVGPEPETLGPAASPPGGPRPASRRG